MKASNIVRVRGMGIGEIAFRLREQWRIGVDRLRFRAGLDSPAAAGIEAFLDSTAAGAGAVKAWLEHGPAERFYASTRAAGREATVELMRRRFPDWVERAVADAERIGAHELDLLAYRNVFVGSEIDWHRNPVTQAEWPKLFWAAYDLPRAPHGDPKPVHELNRHQHLPRLAKAFLLTGDERYAVEAAAQLKHWVLRNPPGCGVNWSSSLEIALRSISWMWTLCLLIPSREFDDRSARLVLQSLFRQLEHVYRYPSTCSSPNTHLLGEGAALFIAGVLFREYPRADDWMRFGAAVLTEEMRKQVSEDGVYRESSSYYHCYAADFYLHALVLARANGLDFPAWMWERLNRMLEFVLHLSRPDGALPAIGDDDGGRALALCRRNYASYADGLCSGAVLFGREDMKRGAGSFAEETLWLLGSEACTTFDALQSAPLPLHRFYVEDGYFIQRSGAGPDASHMIFDCGDLGMLSGGHGHADALSFSLFSQGRELLIDPGTAVYNGAPEWRDYFRSTHAHNAVVVDGRGQCEPGGTFAWRSRSKSRLIACRKLSGVDYLDGEHVGYRKQARAVTHRRRLLFIRPGYWIVLDELNGAGCRELEFFYHFAAGSELVVCGEESQGEVDCRVRSGEATLHLSMFASAPLRSRAVCGQFDPIQGWASPLYGERGPAPVLATAMPWSAAPAMITFLLPERAAPATRRLTAGDGDIVAAEIETANLQDVCVFSPGGRTARLSRYVMSGEVFWLRIQAGKLRQVVAINATSFRVDGDVVFESSTPSPCVSMHLWEGGMVIERGEEEGRVYVRDLRRGQFQRG